MKWDRTFSTISWGSLEIGDGGWVDTLKGRVGTLGDGVGTSGVPQWNSHLILALVRYQTLLANSSYAGAGSTTQWLNGIVGEGSGKHLSKRM